MYTKDAILYTLRMADAAMTRSLAAIEDAPLTFPTEGGGCHPLWVLGHITFIEGLTMQLLGGGESPVGAWGALFGPDTVPVADAAAYPPMAEIAARYGELRGRNMAMLAAMTEADLDTPTAWQPPGLEEHLGTYGKALLTTALHQMAHRGHIADAIRSAGRPAPVLTGAAA